METKLPNLAFFSKMAKTSFLMMALGVCTNANAQVVSTFPWTETFEDNSPSRANWTQIYESGTMAWTFATDATTGSYDLAAYEGSLVANFPANSWDGEKTKLVSPVIDFTGVSNPTLEFYYVNPFWGSEQNILKVFYRISPAAAWEEMATFDSDIDPWTSSGVLSLPNPSATYQIALEGHTLYGYSIMVDQLVVSGALGTDQFSVGRAIAYPNPANNTIQVSAPVAISSVALFSLSGQQMMAKPFGTNEGQLDLSALASGVYFLKVYTQNAVQTIKVAKR